MPDEPYTTTFDEDTLTDFLDALENPYPKNREALVQSLHGLSGALKTIAHTLLDIPARIQPLFPLQDLMTGTRARHLTYGQALAASTYSHVLSTEAHILWVLALHYLIRAHVLDESAIRLPANRAEALAVWNIPGDQLGSRHDPDPASHIEIRFLIAAGQSPVQILENGPDFTLRVENEGIVVQIVFPEQPPLFIFSRAVQDPETGALTNLEAWETVSSKRLADVPGLAKRFRRHHRQDIRRPHTITWPHDFLPLMKTLGDPDNPDRHKLMEPAYQDYLARQAALDLPQNRQGLKRIAKDPRHPCHELARAIGTLPESETVFPIGDYLERTPVDFSRLRTGDPDRELRPEEIIDDVTYALVEYNNFLQVQAIHTWFHHLNVYVLGAVSNRPQPHLDKQVLVRQARDKGDVQAFNMFEHGPDFETTYDEEGTLRIVTEPLFHNTDSTDVWDHVTVREANEKNITFEDEFRPFAYHLTWPTEVLDPLRPW